MTKQNSRAVHMQATKLQSQADEAAVALSRSQDAAQQAVTERSQAESKARADLKVCQENVLPMAMESPCQLAYFL